MALGEFTKELIGRARHTMLRKEAEKQILREPKPTGNETRHRGASAACCSRAPSNRLSID